MAGLVGDISTLTIRNLRASDVARVVAIDAQATGRQRPAYFEMILQRALNYAGLQVSLVAEYEERIVGYLIGSLYFGEFGVTEPTASVDAIGVAEESRRQHVAHSLMQQFRANVKSIGVRSVRTEVPWNDFDALAFFSSEGFGPSKRLCLETDIEPE